MRGTTRAGTGIVQRRGCFARIRRRAYNVLAEKCFFYCYIKCLSARFYFGLVRREFVYPGDVPFFPQREPPLKVSHSSSAHARLFCVSPEVPDNPLTRIIRLAIT